METLQYDPKTMTWDDIREVLADNARQLIENRRQMRETARRMRETDRQMQETDRRMKETDRRMKETDREIKETARGLKETKKLVQETARQMKETDKKFKQMADQFTSTTGHITEGILAPSAIKMFKKAGFNIDHCIGNVKKSINNNQAGMEVDLLLIDTTVAIVVEAKTNCRKKDIDHLLRQMSQFKKFFPEYSDKDVFVVMAALKYDRESKQYAHDKGLLVLSTTDGDIFILEPHKRENLKRF